MAGRRPGSAGANNRAAPTFSVGSRVEYYSKSYDEWISATVGAVNAGGSLKLVHDDGSVLKEQADVSLCRPTSSKDVKSEGPSPRPSPGPPRRNNSLAGPPVRSGGALSSGAGGAGPNRAGPKAGAPASGRSSLSNQPPPRTGPPSGGPSSGSRSSLPGGGGGAGAGLAGAAGAAGAGAAHGDRDPLAQTINKARFYVGDRAKIRDSGREGEIMYIGTPSFSNKEVVGMRLDEKRSKSECDGRAPNNERFFRCPAGYGIFLPSEDVEPLPREDNDCFPSVAAPAEAIDFETFSKGLVGLSAAKQQLSKIRQFVEVQKKRESLGVHGGKPLHFQFRGGRGTGISTVAKMLAHMLRDYEVLAQGQLVEVSRKEVFAGCRDSGETEKQMSKLWKSATGGVLLINDAQAFQDRERSRDEQGAEASEWLAKQLDNMAKRCSGEGAGPVFPQPVVVVTALAPDAQLPDSLQRVKFHTIDFPDYTHEELTEILVKLVKTRKFTLGEGLDSAKLTVHVRDACLRAEASGEKNLVLIARFLDEAIARQTERVWATETVSLQGLTALTEEDFVDSLTPSRDEAMKAALAKLDGVVGLKGVKSFVHSLYAQLKTDMERREAGILASGSAQTLHMIFTGNPGTGKTTLARIVAELLTSMGLLRKGHLVEADRGSLVAGYSGQTALKTRQVVESAMGGVLFVDEAYSLVSADGKDAFGNEALDTLIKMIEDRRQDIVVILAGYPDEMERLIASNPGVRSRFPVSVQFEDYSEEELMQIAEKMLLDDVLVLSRGGTQALGKLLQAACASGKSGREQGNGRAVRNLLEKAKRKMAVRLQGEAGKKRSQAELCTLEAADFEGT